MPFISKKLCAVPAIICLAGGTAIASEEKYPAYDFQPSVIFSNPELIAKSTSNGGSATSELASAAHAAQADPKYPAAYFNPTVIYPTR